VPIKKKKIIAQSHELYTSRRFTNSTIHAATRAHRRQRPQDRNAAAVAVHDDIGGGGGLPRWRSNDRAEHAFVTVHVTGSWLCSCYLGEEGRRYSQNSIGHGVGHGRGSLQNFL
jgi:hypothetical protein